MKAVGLFPFIAASHHRKGFGIYVCSALETVRGNKYEFGGGNTIVMGLVADDLERLAKLLPDDRTATRP